MLAACLCFRWRWGLVLPLPSILLETAVVVVVVGRPPQEKFVPWYKKISSSSSYTMICCDEQTHSILRQRRMKKKKKILWSIRRRRKGELLPFIVPSSCAAFHSWMGPTELNFIAGRKLVPPHSVSQLPVHFTRVRTSCVEALLFGLYPAAAYFDSIIIPQIPYPARNWRIFPSGN